jgi:hypothetical protein
MTITVPNQWTGSGADRDVEIITLPTTANWLIAVVAWRAVDGSTPQVTVGDLPRNLWSLLGTSDNTAANTHVQVWACPHATFDGWSTLNAYVAAMAISASDVGTVTCSVFEGAGLSDWLTVDSVTVGFAAAATTFSIVMPTPAGSANCLMVAGAAIDNAAATVTVTSAGWTALTQVSRTGPDVRMAPTWRTSTATQTPAWSSSVAANWVGIAVAIKETGTAITSSNANHPAMAFQVGLGYDVSTPLQAASYTQPVGRHLSLGHQRGVQAELGVAQPELTQLTFRNDDGALASRPSQSATLNAAGTTSTAKMADASAVGLYKGDWFQLRTAAGALKETTVFQIGSLSSAAGTTTVTFTPNAAVSTASTDILTTTPLDVYTPFRDLATWQGKTYPVVAGWAYDATQSFEVESFGKVAVTGVDTLRMLDTSSLTALRGEILRRSPTHYWPLDDASSSTAGQNLSGYSQAQLIETPSKFGTAAGVADFGASTQNFGTSPVSIVGDPGTAWAQSGLVAADLATKGFALVGSDSAFPSISGGVTIAGISYVTDTASVTGGTLDPTLFILRNLDPGAGVSAGSIIKVSITHTAGATFGRPIITVWDQATHATTNTTSGSTSGLMLPAWQTWALTFDRTSWTMYVDGTACGSGSANLVAAFGGINIGGEADQFNHGRFYNAIHCHVAVFGRKLSAVEVSNINQANHFGRVATTAGGVEPVEARIVRKLNTAAWKGARVISTSGLRLVAEDTAEASVAAKAQTAAAGEDGQVFSDAGGQVQFRSRDMSYQQSSRATLGELTGSGEIPYARDVQIKLDPTFIYNVIRVANSVTTSTSSTTTTSVAADTTSARKYRPNALDRDTRFSDQADAFALACWLLARYATPQRRISQLTINPAAIGATIPAVFSFCLGVEVGDLVTVNRRPVGSPATSQLYRVLKVRHDQGPGQWLTVLTLAVAPAPSLVVGDPVKGILGNNSMAA